jgi:hypothetical protein
MYPKLVSYKNLDCQILASVYGGKYRGPNYRCLVKSGTGAASGAIAGSPGGIAGIVGGGTIGLVAGAVSCLKNP